MIWRFIWTFTEAATRQNTCFGTCKDSYCSLAVIAIPFFAALIENAAGRRFAVAGGGDGRA
jgi:hypothetical protein